MPHPPKNEQTTRRLTESEREVMRWLLEIPLPVLADAIASLAEKMKQAMEERRKLNLRVH